MARTGAKEKTAQRKGPQDGESPAWAAKLMGAQKTIVGAAVGIAVVLWITLEPELAAFISAAIMIAAGLILWRADRLVKRAR